MFENLQLLGSTRRSIVLQTHRGREIENEIELEPGPREIVKYQALLDKFGRDWEQRKPATGVYNCVGHVWASRRTMVIRELEQNIEMILKDDGYRRIDEIKEKALSGDVVLYWQQDVPNSFLHVGVVFEMRPGVSEQSPLPWVLSKWDSTSGEVLHHYNDVPFAKQGLPYICQFWTDRPVTKRRISR